MKTLRAVILWLLVLLMFCLPVLAVAMEKSQPNTVASTDTPTQDSETQRRAGELQRLNEQVQAALDTGELDVALEIVTGALLLQPDLSEIRYARAWIRMEQEDYSGALVDSSYALSLQKDAETYDLRATVLRKLRRYELALLDHTRAMEIEMNSRYLNNRAMTLMQMGRYGEALADLDLALADDLDQTTLLSNRSAALHGLGRCEEALADVERALAQGEDAHSLRVYAMILYTLGRDEEAAKASARSVELGGEGISAREAKTVPKPAGIPAPTVVPKDPESLSRPLVEAAMEAIPGDADTAIDLLNQAIAIYPEGSAAFEQRGLAYGSQERYGEALEDLAYAISIKPSLMRFTNYASMLMYLGRNEEALVEMQRIVETNPYNAYALNNRGNAYFNLDRYEEALADYSAVLALDRSNVRIRLYRAETYQRLERYDEALADYKKVLELAPNNQSAQSGIEEVNAALAALGLQAKEVEPDADATEWANQSEVLRTIFISMLQNANFHPELKPAPLPLEDAVQYFLLPGMVWIDLITDDGQDAGDYMLMLFADEEVYQQSDRIYSIFLRTVFELEDEQASELIAQLILNQEKNTYGETEATIEVDNGVVMLAFTDNYMYMVAQPATYRTITQK